MSKQVQIAELISYWDEKPRAQVVVHGEATDNGHATRHVTRQPDGRWMGRNPSEEAIRRNKRAKARRKAARREVQQQKAKVERVKETLAKLMEASENPEEVLEYNPDLSWAPEPLRSRLEEAWENTTAEDVVSRAEDLMSRVLDQLQLATAELSSAKKDRDTVQDETSEIIAENPLKVEFVGEGLN